MGGAVARAASVVAGALLLLGAPEPVTAGLLPEGWEDRIKLAFTARLRGELVDWFRPPDPPDGDVAHRYGFHPRVGRGRTTPTRSGVSRVSAIGCAMAILRATLPRDGTAATARSGVVI